MTGIVEFGALTGTRVENGAGQRARVVMSEHVTGIGAAHVIDSPIWSDSAYQPTDRLNIRLPRCSMALITTFAPEPYQVKKPLPVSIYSADDECEASFFDANIHTTGDSEHEAFENIKSLILDVFDGLASREPEELGPGPMQQLNVLQQFIFKGV